MKAGRRLQRLAGFLCAGVIGSPAAAAELTGYGVLTTDYVFRGVTYSDSDWALQAAADIALDSGLYFGLWASSVDLRNGPNRRDVEVNYYLGFSQEFRRDWVIGLNVVAYTFPNAKGNFDYDYFEYSVSANYDDRAWLEYSYSPDLYHSSRDTHNLELYVEWPLPAELMLGGGAGYYDVSAFSGSGYAYWQLGVTRTFGRFGLDLRLHDTNRAVPIISTPERAESRVVLSAKLSF